MANLTPQGCRAARGLMNWSVRDLGAKSGISGESISAFENGRPMRESNKAKIVGVFEAEGVEILNGDAPGARLALTRGDLHEKFEEIVVAIMRGADLPGFSGAVCQAIIDSPRTAQDLLPRTQREALQVFDEDERAPDTYGDGAKLVLGSMDDEDE